MRPEPSRELVASLMHWLLRRIVKERTSYLAMLELRLEATRRPELREALTGAIHADLDANIAFHLDAGLPGDADTVRLLYFAMTGLLIDTLTLPDVLGPDQTDRLVEMIVARVVAP